MKKLKLLATDKADLEVIAAALQDAIVSIGGIQYDKAARVLTLHMSRFSHELNETKPRRIKAGLRIDNVLDVQSKDISQDNAEAFCVLLDIKLSPIDTLAAYLEFIFAGGGVLRVRVEVLDLMLFDTDRSHVTQSFPQHNL